MPLHTLHCHYRMLLAITAAVCSPLLPPSLPLWPDYLLPCSCLLLACHTAHQPDWGFWPRLTPHNWVSSLEVKPRPSSPLAQGSPDLLVTPGWQARARPNDFIGFVWFMGWVLPTSVLVAAVFASHKFSLSNHCFKNNKKGVAIIINDSCSTFYYICCIAMYLFFPYNIYMRHQVCGWILPLFFFFNRRDCTLVCAWQWSPSALW